MDPVIVRLNNYYASTNNLTANPTLHMFEHEFSIYLSEAKVEVVFKGECKSRVYCGNLLNI